MSKDFLYPLRCLHGQLYENRLYRRKRRLIKEEYLEKIRAFKKAGIPFVFLVLTPEHKNLGDHAIALAETNWLKQEGIAYIEITGKQLEHLQTYNLLGVMNRHTVLVNGGGNLGTLWMKVEQIQREIIAKNPLSKIIILPNTIYYESGEWGNKELRKSIMLYNKHKHLTIYAREKASYDFMKPLYRDVRLVPDVVLSLCPQLSEKNRQGCMLCLRRDLEKTMTEEQERLLRDQIRPLFGENIADSDMVVEQAISIARRESALHDKFEQFAGAELVVTDRLHGMIFCAITGTPCIVIDSKSPKVRGCYEWIRNLDYIRFADRVENVAEEYEKIPKTEHRYDNSHLQHYYTQLIKEIQNNL